MNRELLEKIVNAVLYEGYILYPYRPSVKNQQRWTFGGLYPENYDLVRQGAESCVMQTQCLVEASETSSLCVSARFLHLTTREVGEFAEPLNEMPLGFASNSGAASSAPTGNRMSHSVSQSRMQSGSGILPLELIQRQDAAATVGETHMPIACSSIPQLERSVAFRRVESLRVGGKLYQAWQEASEREINVEPVTLGQLSNAPVSHPFTVAAGERLEPLRGEDGKIVGVLMRRHEALGGVVEVSAQQKADDLFSVSVRVINRSPMPDPASLPRDVAQLYSLASTHTILTLENGAFVSSIDPPERCRSFAAELRNVGAWPVLVGTAPDRDTILASPIILYDYPQIAPESPGNLFDSTEIDEILSLRIMTLTDEEKQAVAGADERGAHILERTDALASDQIAALHGTVRGLRPIASQEASS